MKKLIFFDTEVSASTKQILDFGAINTDGAVLHTQQLREFRDFLKGTEFFCGHNIIQFDLKYLKERMGYEYYTFFHGTDNVIDTLYWSALLFPEHPYHKLVKDDKLQVEERFSKSSQYELCKRVIEAFEKSNRKMRFVSDWKLFLQESQISDFCTEKGEQVWISTMHKSKGHECNHVVILLDDFPPYSEANKRVLYVAMTRAKKTLTVHYCGSYLRECGRNKTSHVPYLTYENDRTVYPESNMILLQSGMRDIYLSYFYRNQEYVKRLMCGEQLQADAQGCLDMQKRRILFFSKDYQQKIQQYLKNGYRLANAHVWAMAYWRDKKMEDKEENEVLVVLPQLELIKE